MPQGSKSSYSSKQKRQAGHIESGYRRKGVGKKEAEERAWRTVNKRDGGAKGSKARTSSRSRTSGKRKSTGSRSRATTRTRSRSRSRS